MYPSDINLLPIEKNHYKTLESLASECTLFLKRDNNAFPIDKPCKVALFGSGARHTEKGGTGSGDVNSHFFNNIEKELELNGFIITTKNWLDEYDRATKPNFNKFVKEVKKEAKQIGMNPAAFAVGQNMPEFEHDIPIEDYDGDIAIYVIRRVSGEGTDRKEIKGDIYLTEKEISDILYLNNKFEKFLLVLNVPGVVDLSPVLEVKNIYLLSQLGVVTSSILVNVLLGKLNPSGKLSTTWGRIKDYPFFDSFGDKNDSRYLEGIYVGYRYFDINNIEPLFEFGYGKSYSKFIYKVTEYNVKDDLVTLKVNVKNESNYSGKEVIEVYLSRLVDIDNPKNILVAFKKTELINPYENYDIELSFKLRDFANFSYKLNAYVLQKGIYLIRCGNSSRNLDDILKLELDNDVIIKEVESLKYSPDFFDFIPDRNTDLLELDVPTIKLDLSSISPLKVQYFSKYQVKIPKIIKKLTVDELILLNLGDYKTGLAGVIGQNGSLVLGAAGETSLRIKSIPQALSMADGPAGLRLISEYKKYKNKTYPLTEDSIMKGIKPYLPSIFNSFLDPKKNRHKKGENYYQYCSAIPIATALAQSFNVNLCFDIGRLVKKEMELYNVDIWLAPAINIHRNILCGRNFEYYSEDPFLTSEIASSLINGVQIESDKMCTVKHFVCNNQETNRFNSNSIVSERALREIYLRTFERVIEKSEPHAIMTSYNLVNGEHASESYKLLTQVLRNEWEYKGLIMTDWITTGQINDKSSIHPFAHAHTNLSNGVNICMPGSKADIKDIKFALKNNIISREVLENNAAIVYQYIDLIKNK